MTNTKNGIFKLDSETFIVVEQVGSSKNLRS